MAKTTRLTCLFLAVMLVPALAYAQLGIYRPSNPGLGEQYGLEMSIGLWDPSPALKISSAALSAIGSEIDAVKDLGFATTKFRDYQFVAHVARKHKIRVEYLPMKYSADAVLTRSITFNGANYTIGLPVSSSLTWKQWRVGYEYDAVSRDGGFLGIIGELKHTTVDATVASSLINQSASTHQAAPIPGIGGIGRWYPAQAVSLTAELTGFKLPSSDTSERQGRYVEYDLYTTLNFSKNAAAQGGYRSIDVTYSQIGGSGSLQLKGPYIKAVIRF